MLLGSGLSVLDTGRCAVAMQDLEVSWSSSGTGLSSRKMLHQTLALANADVTLEMLRGFSLPLLKKSICSHY